MGLTSGPYAFWGPPTNGRRASICEPGVRAVSRATLAWLPLRGNRAAHLRHATTAHRPRHALGNSWREARRRVVLPAARGGVAMLVCTRAYPSTPGLPGKGQVSLYLQEAATGPTNRVQETCRRELAGCRGKAAQRSIKAAQSRRRDGGDVSDAGRPYGVSRSRNSPIRATPQRMSSSPQA